MRAVRRLVLFVAFASSCEEGDDGPVSTTSVEARCWTRHCGPVDLCMPI